jgi:uncharacterized FlaG/YvyC family protein
MGLKWPGICPILMGEPPLAHERWCTMTRVDTTIATQIADVDRPAQTSQDRQLQVQQANVTQSATSADPGSADITHTDVNAIAAQLKQVVESFSSGRLSLNVDPTGNQLYMQVTDSSTGEVIQQIPTKEMRDLHARLQQTVGALLNKKA